MPNILVDPVLLTFSTAFTTDKQKAEYLQLLDSWAKAALLSKEFVWYCSVMAAHLLQAHQLFPDLSTLQRLLRAYNDETAHRTGEKKSGQDAPDIRQIHKWLQQMIDANFDSKCDLMSKSVEAQANTAGYSQLDVEHGKTVVQPEELALRWDESIQQEMKELIGKVVGCAFINDPLVIDLLIATKALAREMEIAQNKVLTVQTTIAYLPTNQPVDRPLELIEKDISHTFPFLTSPVDLPSSQWEWDGTDTGLRAAIDRVYEQRYRVIVEELQRSREQRQRRRRGTNLDTTPLPYAYTFGSRFITELQALSTIAARENLPWLFVEVAAAIIADQIYTGSFNLKQFRTSAGGGTRVRQRWQDKAYRAYVTPNRGGWRLNYWKGPDEAGRGRVEFSVIQREGDEPKIYFN